MNYTQPTVQDCLKPAPEPYSSFMKLSHFITFPFYMVTIYALTYKTPSILRAYRNLILYHTIGNILFEVYITIFMLPVTYLPHPVFRGAGLVKYVNLGGLVQFYILAICVVVTFNSMISMFKYRFDAVMSDEPLLRSRYSKSIILFRILTIFFPIFGISMLPFCTPKQQVFKEEMWNRTPGFSPEIFCSTTVMSPPLTDNVFLPIMIIISVCVVQATITVTYSVTAISKKLEYSSRKMSLKTIRMQKMLLTSLLVQTIIHAVLFGGPLIVFVYTLVFTLDYDGVAMVFIVFVSYHGAFSTVGMISFTKPFRMTAMQLFWKVPHVIQDRKVSVSNAHLHETSRDVFANRK